MRAGLKGCVHRCPPGLPASETLACQGLVSFSLTSSPEDTSNIFRGQIYKSFSIFKRLKMPAIVLAHTSTSQSVTLAAILAGASTGNLRFQRKGSLKPLRAEQPKKSEPEKPIIPAPEPEMPKEVPSVPAQPEHAECWMLLWNASCRGWTL